MTRPDRQSYYRALAEAQLSVWANTSGWFFWNYKLAVDGPELDGWDFGKSVELGYLDVG
jgi:aryl-phospho-beta-D-glucosidase BglC (GH1 family)